ncbi:MAG TPA: hypothetical protein DCX89_09570 [Saprospirales bacterium]|nr:hypothetical protein [Saprospirales bacterium]HAY72125.1 hypothetical protein [Saprospirales bacterium]HRQ28700.1 TolC family protein [Saprospiraceae bacterium]
MIRKFGLLILTLIFTARVFSQDIPAFTLNQAIDYALTNHKDISIAENERLRARQQIIETRSMGLPQVNAGVDYNYFIQLPTSLIPASFLNPSAPEDEFIKVAFGTKNSLTASANINSLLYDASFFTALKISKKYTGFADLNYQSKRTELRNAVRKAYLPPLMLQENIKTIDENIRVLKNLLKETNEMYKSGFIEKLDVDKLNLAVQNQEVLKKDLQKTLKLALDALKLQIGYPLESALKLSDSIQVLSAETEESQLMDAFNYQNRLEYSILEYSKELTELNVDRFKKSYYPSLRGFVNYQYVVQGDNLFKNPISTPAAITGFSLAIPIFDGLFKSSKIQQGKLDISNIENQSVLLKSGIDFQVQSARENYLNAKEIIKSRQDNLALAKNIFDTAQLKYKEGVGSSLEIIQAEQSLLESQMNYLKAQYDFLVAKIDLEIALGK